MNRMETNIMPRNRMAKKGAKRKQLWWMQIPQMVLYLLMETNLRKSGVRIMKKPRQPKSKLVGAV
jgi:hypothetical protein